MVSVPDCGLPLLAATVAVTVPLPVPDAGLTVTKPALLTAVHVHVLSPVTGVVTVPTLPVAVALVTTSGGRGTLMIEAPPIGETATGADSVPGVGGAAALCEIVNAVPATVSVAVRAAPVFAATENVVVPLPLPEA